MWSALVLVAASAVIVVLRLRKPIAIAVVLCALAIGIVLSWSNLAEPSYTWLPAADVVFTGRGDVISHLAASLVAAISGIVAVFALGDPETDDAPSRFFATYALFVAAMLAFVDAASVLFAYVCWEVMGVASFVLIGHITRDPEAGRGARRALTTTRLGDLSVLIGAALLASGRALPGGSFLVVGAALKSAQLGASPWLVGAMVAPTPVSALLHSATLVAAGPFLVARFVPLQSMPAVATSLLVYAIITALVAAIFAGTSDDAKRTLAWSSIEQLSQAFVASAVGTPLLAYAVLAGHALAKPALFFAAGMQRIATGTSRYAAASHSSWRTAAFVAAMFYGGLALVGIPPYVSSWALAETWTAASHTRPLLLLVGVTLALLGGWYVARFIVLLRPVERRRFDAARIGLGARAAVWLMCILGVTLSLVSFRSSLDAATIALPIAAGVGAAGCFALRRSPIVQRPPLFADGVDQWDSAFFAPTMLCAGAVDTVDRALLLGSDRLGATMIASGLGADVADRAIDRATSEGSRDISRGGIRAGSLVSGNDSRYLAVSGAVFVAAALVAMVIIVIRSFV